MGVCSALRTAGSIASTHRAPSHTIAKGDDINLTMAELFGRSNGNCHGKGGSMNIGDISGGMLGAVAPWSLECPYSPAQTRTSSLRAAKESPMKGVSWLAEPGVHLESAGCLCMRNRSMGLGQPSGGTLPMEDVLGGSRVGLH